MSPVENRFAPPPELDGVQHRFINVGRDVTLHVADAGPASGPPVMLVHGFPQNWWMWHELIQPLASDGYRVLCPDLRGAGWSTAPRGRYLKCDMAEDLAVVLRQLNIGRTRLVAHDWGGPVSVIMLLRHPEVVSGFFGVNTLGPWLGTLPGFARDSWRYAYQIPLVMPLLGPWLIGEPKARYPRLLARWVNAGHIPKEFDTYVSRLREPGHAVAASRWYRAGLATEAFGWLRGEYADALIDVPVRFLHGTLDPALTPKLLNSFAQHATDFEAEIVEGVGHSIVEQRPELVLDRLRPFRAMP
ncbi:alpha/beta fold hydrolase [Mycobacterium sp. 4858]|uniref:alpha/beta fold hydrolase n=1 Tax=Mycobacterium sp. 4858 TaxID=2057185 RepID=UPI000C823EB9|nr:alpha/beta hydrolase [Mycobacterium sp. 4858]